MARAKADFIVPFGKKPVTKATEAFTKKLGHNPQYHGAHYLKDFTNPEKLSERIDLAVRALKGRKFDAIAFTGMSGALIGPPVALKLGKPFLLVRKSTEETHSSWGVEGDYAAKTYIILDDFQETGGTVRRIKEQIGRVMPSAKFEGFLAAKWLTEMKVAAYEGKKTLYPLEQ